MLWPVVPLLLALGIALTPVKIYWALFLGVMLSLGLNLKIDSKLIKKQLNWCLQSALVLLGATLSFRLVVEIGVTSVLLTMASVALVMLAGGYLGHVFKLEEVQEKLISFATAICGGSAIAALAPILKANGRQISIALMAIYFLNMMAVFVYPILGEWLELNSIQFGVWSALAIHDTASVVAAAELHSEEALRVASMTKLTRALWIVPVALFFSWSEYKKTATNNKVMPPLFIILFFVAIVIANLFPQIMIYKKEITQVSKVLLKMSLFLVGLNITREQLKDFKPNAFAFALTLCMIVTFSTLGIVLVLF